LPGSPFRTPSGSGQSRLGCSAGSQIQRPGRHAPFLLVVALSAPPLIGAPGHAQTEPDSPDGTIAVESDANQDAAIAVRIREIIGQLDGYDAVSVSVADGIVTLGGTVSMPPRSPRSPSLVARVEGVVAIENEVAESTDVRERLDPAIARIEGRIAQFWPRSFP
jgi:small conductance mechanosensitive channel